MATDENVVQFPKGKKEVKHGPEDYIYMAKVRTNEGQLKMIVQACSMGCVFAAIMEAMKELPEVTGIEGVVIVNIGKPGESGDS